MMVDATVDDDSLDRLIGSIKHHLGAHGHLLLIYDCASKVPSFFRTSWSQESIDLLANASGLRLAPSSVVVRAARVSKRNGGVGRQ
jgi:hypothetical protein